MDFDELLVLLIIFSSIYFIFKKFNILIDDISFSEHKKVGNLNKSPIILGGVYITLSLILLLDKNNEILKFFCILMLFLLVIR